jgi:quinol monooxygenase YgiN
MTNQGKNAIYAVLFHVIAKPGKRRDLFEFLEWDGKESMKRERGTLRFDVFQDPENGDAFYVYEAYEDYAAFEEHKTHDPFNRWDSPEFQNAVVLSHRDLSPLIP